MTNLTDRGSSIISRKKKYKKTCIAKKFFKIIYLFLVTKNDNIGRKLFLILLLEQVFPKKVSPGPVKRMLLSKVILQLTMDR